MTSTPDNLVGSVFDIPVFKLACEDDPGEVLADDVLLGDLPDSCRLVEGVEFLVQINGEEPGTVYSTGENGSFSVEYEEGDDIRIEEVAGSGEDGYIPRENPIVIVEADRDEEAPIFVNLPVPSDGEVDVLKRVCTTETERATEIYVNGSTSAAEDCPTASGVSFTITGDGIDGEIKRQTDADGWITLALPAGTYRIREDATGATAEFNVRDEEVTDITVVNYKRIDKLPDTGLPGGEHDGGRSSLLLLFSLLALGTVAHTIRQSRARAELPTGENNA